MWGSRKDGVACVRARRVFGDQRATHWQEASRGSGSFSTCRESRLGCDSWALPVGVAGLGRGEEAGARRGGCKPCCLARQHPSPACSILTKSWKQDSAPPLLPGSFCCRVSRFCLFSPAEQLLFCSLCLCKPWGCQMLVCLGLTCPQAKPSCCCSDLGPPSLELPQQHTSIHPILFEAL